MNSLTRLPNRRLGYISAAFAMVFATIVAPFASAAQVTERFIQLSSSAATATGVTYNINFTAVSDAGAFVVDFCSDSPLLGEACGAPVGFSVSSATTPTAGFTRTVVDANTIRIAGDIDVSTDDEVSVVLENVANPTNPGPLYARIVTYVDDTAATGYTSAAPGTHIDDGGVAMSITPTIAVSGAVLESMTFCVAGEAIDGPGCTMVDEDPLAAPTVKLGRTVGDVTVLDADDVYEGKIYTQLSTNAAGGAIVNLKSNTIGCGGLSRVGAADFAAGCGIKPANTLNGFDVTAGQAKFGVKTATAAGLSGNSSGTLRAFDEAGGSPATPFYNSSAFKFFHVAGDLTGVTSTYGDPFLDTSNAPLSNMGMEITFGASANNTTTAGRYTADLSMIATGKF